MHQPPFANYTKTSQYLTPISILLVLTGILSGCGDTLERKAKYMKRGQDYLAEKDFVKARIEFKNVFQIDPKDPEIHYYMGVLEEADGNHRQAFGLFSQTLELDPNHIEAKLKLASMYAAFDLEKSISLNNEVLTQQPDNVDGLINKALIKSKQGAPSGAITDLRNILDAHPTNVKAALALSAFYRQNGAKEELSAVLSNAIEHSPEEIDLRKALARAYLDNKDYDGAEQQLLDIIKLEPKQSVHRVALASIFVQTEKFSRAEKILQESINSDTSDQARYIHLAEFIAQFRSQEKATAFLEKVVRDNPEFETVHFKFAKRLIEGKENDKARHIYEMMSDRHGLGRVGLQARNKLARLEYAQDNKSIAKQLLEEVLTENPKDNEALFLKGRIALEGGGAEDAVILFRQLLKDQPNNVDLLTLLAAAHNRLGSPEVAVKHLSKAVELDPDKPMNRIQYAKILSKTGKFLPALEQLDSVLNKLPDYLPALKAKSSIHAMQGNALAMEQTLKIIMQNHPNEIAADIKLGRLYQFEGKLDNAEEIFKAALRKQPISVQALGGLVDGYQAAGRPEKAEQEVKRFLERDSKSVVARILLGRLYFETNKYADAITQFDLALQEKPSNSSVVTMLVNAYRKQGKIDSAIEYLQQQILENPDHPTVFAHLGQIYASQKQFSEAETAFLKAKQNNPKWAHAHRLLASLYVARDEKKRAIDAFHEGIREIPSDITLQMGLGHLYTEIFDYDQAIAVYEKILEKQSGHEMAKNNLAALLSYRDDSKSLKRAYNLAVSFKTVDEPIFQDTLGWIYYKLNDLEQAIPLLQKAADSRPEAAVVQYHLGMAFHKQGNARNAKRYLEQAINLNQEFPGANQAKQVFALL